ncbi:MAG: hypothetical protein ACPG49_06685 [Chitinophagales bacterium]
MAKSRKRRVNKKKVWENRLTHAAIHIGIFLGVLFLVNLASGPSNKKVNNHSYSWDPKTYPLAIQPMKKGINQQKPDLILMGNSQLRQGIIADDFIQLTNVATTRVFFGGSGAAWWYLVMKNVIDKAKHKPKKLALFFRDNLLTGTQNGIKGQYKPVVDMVSLPEEPLLERLTFSEDMSSEAYLMNTYWTTHQKRKNFKLGFERTVKEDIGASLLGLEEQEIDTIIQNVFADENMDQAIFEARFQLDMKNKASFNFNEDLPNSYLPEIIRLAKKNNIELIFVRVKLKKYTEEGEGESPEMSQYMKELKQYLKTQETPLLDFSKNKKLTAKHFSDHIHLNKEGQKIFTKAFAAKIAPLINSLRQKEIPKGYKDIGI